MPYKVQSSEKLRKSGADFETKAMLYLLNFREDSSQINYFVVDFFNDITGMDRMARKLWDVQSKASKTGSAKTIGRELVTLYKNHVSDFDFFTYIIFLGGVPDTFRIDAKQNVFQSTNITPKALKSVLSGLKEECTEKEYIESDKITDESLEKFLKLVWFVVDDKEPADYIKAIISNHPKIVPSDSELIAIFNEIRNLFTKRGSVVSGSEETVYYIARLISIAKLTKHSCPIIMDSFRAEDLSTEKEERVLALLSELKRQCILTTTLKAEEKDKYVKMAGINAIDYTGHHSNKILGTEGLPAFMKLLSGLGISLQ